MVERAVPRTDTVDRHRFRLPPEQPPPPSDLSIVDSKELIREILRRVGEDPDREGLRQTPPGLCAPGRKSTAVTRSARRMCLSRSSRRSNDDEMVLLRDIEFFSTCEHHMLPFHGKAHIAYLPNKKIVGLSKLARLTDVYARRLQVQERLDISDCDRIAACPQTAGCRRDARGDASMACAAAESGKREGKMVTSRLLRSVQGEPASRAEFLALVNG